MTGSNREHRIFLVVAAIALVVIAASFLLRPGQDEHTTDTARDTDRTAERGTSDSSATGARGDGKGERRANARSVLSEGRAQFGDRRVWGGEGRNMDLPRHRLTITLSSPGSVGYTAWIIPTASPDRGSHRTASSSWSMTTTVYGRPAYAAVFAQADSRGTPVTCTITVDGRVTERRTTRGPYGAMWCKG